ncbi:hypothetical protein RHMOL_Rhmol05G0149600 [Rhododendron molle]|uniref:Uncharacterized protein n=1 Tax=Rhododendron molle TaxID=49168 RepID=A0ACC0NQT2_RHOML|nr:hypothetical protein RHMOL_Rhmol05G0149600 [Rhododendron molle]
MADHSTGEGEGEVVDQPGDRGEQMAVEPVEEQAANPSGLRVQRPQAAAMTFRAASRRSVEERFIARQRRSLTR